MQVFTGDVKTYDFPASIRFDRVLSIEMFEHVREGQRGARTAAFTDAHLAILQMKNYALLFEKISRWLKTVGESKLFIHIFCHRTTPYHFEEGDGWMTKHFFSGGTMPCHDLFLYFQQHVSLDDIWWINGNHYAKTCEAWLKKQDKNNVGNQSVQMLRRDAKNKGVEELEGEKTFYRCVLAQLCASLSLCCADNRKRSFRVFYLACAEFFATHGGEEWGVGACHSCASGVNKDLLLMPTFPSQDTTCSRSDNGPCCKIDAPRYPSMDCNPMRASVRRVDPLCRLLLLAFLLLPPCLAFALAAACFSLSPWADLAALLLL